MTFSSAARVVERAIEQRAFPAAVVEVGDATRPLWQHAAGHLTFDAGALPATIDTIFDLASLTKVLATASIVMREVERGALALDDAVAQHLDSWQGVDRSSVTIRDLLSHSAGLTAWAPFFHEHRGRAAFERAITRLPLEYAPRTKSVYSDLGFMLLGFILDGVRDPGFRSRGEGSRLSERFDSLRTQMAVAEDLQFHPPDVWKQRTAPTEVDTWRGRLLVGEPHDENCAALGGVAGHAGLFGTAAAVGACARHVLQILKGRTGVFRKETVEHFISRRADIPESSRALGWDTMLPTSSCGARMSPRAFGHTGFTGTSLWIDPDRRVYVVLLTNRVHPTRANDAILRIRPALHDAVMEDLERDPGSGIRNPGLY
jgi:CubicO group peptidase (beta-lactamase class C family)